MSPSEKHGTGSRAKRFDPTRLKRLIDQQFEGNAAAAGRAAGLSQPTIFNLLAGKYNPRTPTLEALARALHVSTDFLLSRPDRLPDDTFGEGMHYAIRHIQRELAQLEQMLDAGEIGPEGRSREVRAVAERGPNEELPGSGYRAGKGVPAQERRGKSKRKKA